MCYGLVCEKLLNMDGTLDHQKVPGLAYIDFKFQLIFKNVISEYVFMNE